MFTTQGENQYQYLRGNLYKQHPVTLSRFFSSCCFAFSKIILIPCRVSFISISPFRSSILEDDCVIGGGTKIGEDSIIRRSVVGRNCQIGNGVVLEDSFIWDNCEIKVGRESAVRKLHFLCSII